MDSSMMNTVMQWVEQQFAGKQTVSKDELASKAQGSDLPQQAKQSIQELPPGNHDKNTVMSKIQDSMMSKVGGGMGGMMGGGQGGKGGQGGGQGGAGLGGF